MSDKESIVLQRKESNGRFALTVECPYCLEDNHGIPLNDIEKNKECHNCFTVFNYTVPRMS